jgi:urease accessory protein
VISFSGHLRLQASRQDSGRTILSNQAFRAPFHLSKPYWDPDAATLLVQVVNPTAGILSGDRLESIITAQAHASLLVTTPSASRVFTMREDGAECVQRFAVEPDGWLEVMPEPLVPHRGCRYRQSTEIDVAAGGGLFFVDQLMPGRTGFGEAWSWTTLKLDVSVRFAGKLVLRERFAHSGAELRALAEANGTGASACFANGILIGAGPGDRTLGVALHRLSDGSTRIGLSALREGGWSLRVVAPDPVRLRDALRAIRRELSHYFPGLKCDPRKL